MVDVCLPLVPFARVEAPSLALGIFKAKLSELGVSSKILYPNLDFAYQIGIKNYYALSMENITLIGEWLFSYCLFQDKAPSVDSYFKYLEETGFSGILPSDDLLSMRISASNFIDQLAVNILRLNPKIVSCSSTFQQHVSSLALLKRLKSLRPSLITVMGGANCESVMGLTTKRLFGFVDFVLSGEGDVVFPSFCHALLTSDLRSNSSAINADWPGVFCSVSDSSSLNHRPVVDEMDEISYPDFDDYFNVLDQHPLNPVINPCLPVEASRGCWWGQQHHCTFCGLNGDGLAYRSKTPRRMFNEMKFLRDKYGDLPFEFVDNIVPREYLTSFFSDSRYSPILLSGDSKLFFEVKANLSRQQLKIMKEAGVCWIQPGIESLHDLALKELKKGTTCLVNLQLLRWSLELGLYVTWSILTEFPGEQTQWLSEMQDLLPMLHHLQPPMALLPVQYHRFSPYFNHANQYQLNLSPAPAYSCIYPFSEEDIKGLSYSFVDNNAPGEAAHDSLYSSPQGNSLYSAINSWRDKFQSRRRPLLCYQILPDGNLQIVDTRECAFKRIHLLSGLEKELMLLGDSIVPIKQISRLLSTHFGDLSPEMIQQALSSLADKKLILIVRGSFLSLPVGGSLPSLPTINDFPGGAVVFDQLASYPSLSNPLELAYRQS